MCNNIGKMHEFILSYTWLCASLCSVLCHAYLHEMSFPVNFMYFKNYTLANIPTKLMYKHRVDYYDYTTVLYSMQQATHRNSFARRKSHIGRGVHASSKRMSGKVHASGNARRGKMNVGRGVTHRDQCVPRTVSFLATICLYCFRKVNCYLLGM